jgi:hypothetical protein
MVEEVGMAVASFQIATSLLRVEEEKLGCTVTEETRTTVPPELRFLWVWLVEEVLFV